MKHTIAYSGKRTTALGLMREEYIPLFVPWVNWRIGIEGTSQRPPYSEAQGIEWLRNLDKSKGTTEVFAIFNQVREGDKESYAYIGHTGIHHVEWPHGVATTGSVIGPVESQGKGLGTEAKLLLLYHAFMIMGLRKIISRVKAFNTNSAGHLLKCGYTPVGRHRKHHLHEGEYIDEVLFEVFREDWEPIWDVYQKDGTLPRLTDAQRVFLQNGCVI
jgi:RimJ/RimL family protein N-acetyltransferase